MVIKRRSSASDANWGWRFVPSYRAAASIISGREATNVRNLNCIQWMAGLAIAVALMAEPRGAGAGTEWTVRGVGSASTPIVDISDADLLLGGELARRSDATAHYPTLNFNEPDAPLGGHFAGYSAFPGTSPGHEQDFAAQATGEIHIPAAGDYTFGVSSDDGFSLAIGAHTMSFAGLRYPAESYGTFSFASAGNYPVDLIYFQHLKRAELELFSSAGNYASWGQIGSNFQLVGSAAPGALQLVPTVGTVFTPEPSTLLVMMLAMMGLAGLRKPGRAARC